MPRHPIRRPDARFALALSLGVLGGAIASGGASAGPLERAQAAQARGDLRGAQLEWRNLVRAEPDSASAHAALAANSLDLGDGEVAEKEARAALERGFDPVAGNDLLLRAYMVTGRWEALLRDFPARESPAGVGGVIAAARATAEMALGQWDEATQSVAMARRLAPEAPQTGVAVSALALHRNDRAAAEAAVDGVLARDPVNTEALLRKGSLQFERRETAAAVASFTTLLDHHPGQLAALLRRGEALLQLEEVARAQADVDAALAIMPASAPGVYLRALLQARRQDWAGVDESLTRLGPMMANFPDAFLLLATAKRGIGQVAQAEEAVARHVARAPDDPRGRKLQAAMDLQAGRPEDAAATLTALADRGTTDVQALDMLGRVLMSLSRPRLAATALQSASKLAPNDAGILGRLAAARLATGDTAGSAEAASSALRLSGSAALPGGALPGGAAGTTDTGRAAGRSDARQILAFAAMFRGDTAQAQAELAMLSPEARKSESSGVLEGTLALQRMDLPAARKAFAGVLERKPESNPARMGLVRVASLEGKGQEAEGLLEAVLMQEPGHVEAAGQLAAAAMPGGPRSETALAVLRKVQAAAPREPLLGLTLANLLMRHGKSAEAATLLSGEALRAAPGIAVTLARAEAHAAAGQWAESEEDSRAALAAEPDSVAARRQLAGLLVRANDPRGAEAVIQQGLRTRPNDEQLQQTLAGLLLKSQGMEAAMAAADRLSRQASAQPQSLALPGDVLATARQPEAAARAYATAYAEAPSAVLALRQAAAWRSALKPAEAITALSDWLARSAAEPDLAKADTLLMLSQLHLEAGQVDLAASLLRRVVAVRPEDAVALNNLAWAVGQRGDAGAMPEAQALAERAFFLAPSADTADTLGWILARRGAAERAVPLLRQAQAVRSGDPGAAFRLAYALRATGARDEAVGLLTPAMAGAQPFPERAEAERLLVDLRSGR